jgi:alanyl-tRNA synthetase
MPGLDILRSATQKGRIVTRTAAQVRQDFIDFFCQKHGHTFVPSSPVVPHDDPTLLFANAGMNQFKPYFLGTETPKHRRVVNTQKCIRAGGKHNDLDDVGHDTYHHTFFEMLGNWSFGDYFKKEAIAWAWELLTRVWGLDKTRLHATYFGGDPAEGLDPDLEARDLWTETLRRDGVDASHVHPGDKKDNFWEMGETGPCGPCSEIHIDLTPEKNVGQLINAGDPRIIEIWNLVFIQFNRGPDGKLTPLPAKHVDTGMGFERVTAILQGHNNNYATDVFVPIIQAIEKISGYTYGTSEPRAQATGSASEPRAPATGSPTEPRPQATGSRTDRGSPKTHSLALGARTAGAPTDSNRYAAFVPGDMRAEACRVIADHVRTLTFAITDGAVPDKEGRGYVLRRILRRAVRYGWQYLNLHEPFLCRLVDIAVDTMGEAFPELRKNRQHVKDVLREEEESFERTLDRGLQLFDQAVADACGRAFAAGHGGQFVMASRGELGGWSITIHPPVSPLPSSSPDDLYLPNLDRDTLAVLKPPPVVSAEDAFKLHDTYGFPIDLTQVMAQEKGLTVDIGEYERLMEEARERARASRTDHPVAVANVQQYGPTQFTRTDGPVDSRVVAILTGRSLGIDAATVPEGEPAVLILDRSPFYAEKGGQIGDVGTITRPDAEFEVTDTQWQGEVILHYGICRRGTFYAENKWRHHADKDAYFRVLTIVTPDVRQLTMKNHTATHVLNWALREVLGEHVQQKGSLVDPEKTRFDFSHPRAMTPEEIERVEQLVNDKIKARLPVHSEEVEQQQALKIAGLRAVFGERYPDRVRVLSVGAPVAELVKNPDNPQWRDVSIEFCGGTHVRNTGDIEHFVIASEEAVAKGVRRIVGLTGDAAKTAAAAGEALLKQATALGKGPPDALAALQTTLTTATLSARHRTKLRGAIEQLQKLAKEQQKSDAAGAADVMRQKVTELLAHAEKKGDTTIVVAEMPDVPIDQLKTAADMLKQKCGSAAVLFGVRVAPVEDEPAKAILLAAMTPDLIKKGLKAGDLVKAIAPLVSGGGGGPPTMAQAGGKNPEKLAEALAAGRKWLAERL